MKKLFFIFLCLTTFSCFSHELDNLVSKLKEDDYQTREQATEELSNVDCKYLPWMISEHLRFLKIDPETSTRLYKASQELFFKTELKNTTEYKFLYGDSGIETYDIKIIKEAIPLPPDEVDALFRDPRVVGNKVVLTVKKDSSAEGKIFKGDIIECFINEEGNPISADTLNILGGEPMKYKIKRFNNLDQKLADEDFEEVLKKDIREESKDFKEIEIQIINGWKDRDSVDRSKEEEVKNRRWIIYLAEETTIALNEKDKGKPEAKAVVIRK